MMRFAAEASRVMARAEIIELTRGQARRAVGHRRAHGRDDGGRRADPLGPAAGDRRRPGGHPRRRRADAHDPPRRPPTARASCPACCWRSAAWRICPSPRSVGLERLLWPSASPTTPSSATCQRVRGVLDARPEIAGRVRAAGEAGRVGRASAAPSTCATSTARPRLRVRRTTARATSCRGDAVGGGRGAAVPRRFTDALRRRAREPRLGREAGPIRRPGTADPASLNAGGEVRARVAHGAAAAGALGLVQRLVGAREHERSESDGAVGLAAPIETPTLGASSSPANAAVTAARTAAAASSPRVGAPGTQTANSSPPRRPATPWAASGAPPR